MITIPLPHPEFYKRSITRHELLAFAEHLGWPAVEYWAIAIQRIQGERQWREAALQDPAGRRGVYRQLVEIEHGKKGEEKS